MTRLEYPAAFEAEWALTAKTGSKDKACDWWEANGRQTFGASWKRWEASDDWRQDWYKYPHVISWMNDGRWKQDPGETRVKTPAAAPPPARAAAPVESWAVREERARVQRSLERRFAAAVGDDK